jgi:phage major head subunit gpT-like protein
MLVTQGIIQSLHVAFSSLFSKALASAPQDYKAVAEVVPSATKRNEYSWIRNIPRMKKSVGAKVFEDFVRKGYQITNNRYETLAEVDVDDIEDDNIGSYELAFRSHGTEAANWLGQATFTLLPRGLTADGVCFDDQPFFSTAHPKLDGTTYSNLDSGASAPWYLLDDRAGVKPLIVQNRKDIGLAVQNMPTDDSVFEDDKVRWKISGRKGFGYGFPQTAYCSQEALTEEKLEAAMTAMMNQVGDDGRKLSIMPRILVVGPTNYFKAKKLIEATLNQDGGSNVHAGSLRVIQSQFVESVEIEL